MSISESDYYSCEELATPVSSPASSPPPSRPASTSSDASAASTGSAASAASAAPTERVRKFTRRCNKCHTKFRVAVRKNECFPKLCSSCAGTAVLSAVKDKACAWCRQEIVGAEPLCSRCWCSFKHNPRSMLRTRRALRDAPTAQRVSLNAPIRHSLEYSARHLPDGEKAPRNLRRRPPPIANPLSWREGAPFRIAPGPSCPPLLHATVGPKTF